MEPPKKWNGHHESRSQSPSECSISSQGSYSNPRQKRRFHTRSPQCNTSNDYNNNNNQLGNSNNPKNGADYHQHSLQHHGHYHQQQSHYQPRHYHQNHHQPQQQYRSYNVSAGGQYNHVKRTHHYEGGRRRDHDVQYEYYDDAVPSYYNKGSYNQNAMYSDYKNKPKLYPQRHMHNNYHNYHNNHNYHIVYRTPKLIWDQINKCLIPAGTFVPCKEIDLKISNNLNLRLCKYKAEVTEMPEDLLNGSEWDMLSQQVWEKFQNSQQRDCTFEKKLRLRDSIYKVIRVRIFLG